MVKQFLKIAGVRSEKEFYNKYPTKQAFFDAHPDAEMLDMAMYGGAYQFGGGVMDMPDQYDSTMDARRLRAQNLRNDFNSMGDARRLRSSNLRNTGSDFSDKMNNYLRESQREKELQMLYNNPPQFRKDSTSNYRFPSPNFQMGGGMEQQASAQGGGGDQQEQIIQFVAQALQQGADPQEIMQQLVEAGIPQEQAGQLIQAVAEQLQQMTAQPQQEQQPMMRMGGAPCYGCGGRMADGGQAYSGTYMNGTYFQTGGTYVPTYADMAYNPYGAMFADGGSFDNAGFEALPTEVQRKIRGASKKMVGGDLKVGGEYNMTQAEVDDLVKKGYKVKYVK